VGFFSGRQLLNGIWTITYPEEAPATVWRWKGSGSTARRSPNAQFPKFVKATGHPPPWPSGPLIR